MILTQAIHNKLYTKNNTTHTPLTICSIANYPRSTETGETQSCYYPPIPVDLSAHFWTSMHFNYLKFCKVTNTTQQGEEHTKHWPRYDEITQGKNTPEPPNIYKISITKKYRKKNIVPKITLTKMGKNFGGSYLENNEE